MSEPLIVVCAICGQEYNPYNPAVEYRSLDRRWWCADETACTARAARHQALFDLVINRIIGRDT